jgi:hypothetical protein
MHALCPPFFIKTIPTFLAICKIEGRQMLRSEPRPDFLVPGEVLNPEFRGCLAGILHQSG